MEVKETYDAIAKSFSHTRYKKWNCVNEFLKMVKSKEEKIFEMGCGNGKNLLDHAEQSFGIDISDELCKICISRNLKVQQSDILTFDQPSLYHSFDFVMCVAVIHHLPLFDQRREVLCQMKRYIKKGGRGLVTGWNVSESKYDFKKGGDHWVKFGEEKRYYYIFQLGELRDLVKEVLGEESILEYRNEKGNDVIYFTL